MGFLATAVEVPNRSMNLLDGHAPDFPVFVRVDNPVVGDEDAVTCFVACAPNASGAAAIPGSPEQADKELGQTAIAASRPVRSMYYRHQVACLAVIYLSEICNWKGAEKWYRIPGNAPAWRRFL